MTKVFGKRFVLISLVVVLALGLIAATACVGQKAPTFPPPEPWFEWGQRYIYQIAGTGVGEDNPPIYTYLKGFGNYEPDFIDPVTSQAYKVGLTLASVDPEVVVRKQYLRAEGDADQWHWYLKGSWSLTEGGPVELIFDGELLTFDYPLSLGKTWSDNTTISNEIPVAIDAVVIAYIPGDIDELQDIMVAQGYEYTLPDINGDGVADEADALAVPLPLRELGNISWEAMMNVSDSEAHMAWDEVEVPGGPHQGENIQGYYVVQQSYTIAGNPMMDVEAWKDVRGFIPVQVVDDVTTIAYRWTGNFP